MDAQEFKKSLISLAQEMPDPIQDRDGYAEFLEIAALFLPSTLMRLALIDPKVAKTLWDGVSNFQEETFARYASIGGEQ